MYRGQGVGQRTGDRIRGRRSDMETCRHGQRAGDRTEDGGQTWRHVDMARGQGSGQRTEDIHGDM